jgi:hypothetical protein
MFTRSTEAIFIILKTYYWAYNDPWEKFEDTRVEITTRKSKNRQWLKEKTKG